MKQVSKRESFVMMYYISRDAVGNIHVQNAARRSWTRARRFSSRI